MTISKQNIINNINLLNPIIPLTLNNFKERVSIGTTIRENVKYKAILIDKGTISMLLRQCETIEDLLDVDIEYRKDETTGKYTSNILTHAGYTGQVISEDSYHHLVCLVKREAFNPTTIKHVTEMRKKAKEQNKFTL